MALRQRVAELILRVYVMFTLVRDRSCVEKSQNTYHGPHMYPKLKAKAMSTYTGTITTAGKSEAIRLQKALFRSHPEFRQKAKVHAYVIGPGTMLVCLASVMDESETDPVKAAFMRFLSADMVRAPACVQELDVVRLDEVRAMIDPVDIDDDDGAAR
jgi:antitoxin PrlF